MRNVSLRLIAAAALAAFVASGCGATRPPDPNAPPPTAEQLQQARIEKCESVHDWVSIGTTAAALAIRKSNDRTLKDAIASALAGANVAVDKYCLQVMAGGDPNAEYVARNAVRAALDELNRRILAADSSAALDMLRRLQDAGALTLTQAAPAGLSRSSPLRS